MSVEIQLADFDGQSLHTNSLLRGRVRVKLKKPEQAQTVTQVLLSFYGQSFVHITRRRPVQYTKYTHHHRHELHYNAHQPIKVGHRTEWRTSEYVSQCLLFSYRLNLVHSEFRMPAESEDCALEFPFEIRIPTHSGPIPPEIIQDHGCQCFSASRCFPNSLGYGPPGQVTQLQPFPDSVEIEDNSVELTKALASVRYTLNAFVPGLPSSRWTLGKGGPAESTVMIPLHNPVSLPARPVQYQTLRVEDEIQTLRLLNSNQERSFSFRDKMRSVLKKDQLPWLAVGIVFRASELLFLDQPTATKLPFSIGIHQLASGIGETPAVNGALHVLAPRFFLKGLKLRLVAHTTLRGGHDRFSGYGPKRFENLNTKTFFKFKASSSTPELPLLVGHDTWTELGTALGISLGDMLSVGAEPDVGGITGEFLTPNFWRRWGIEWDMRIDCAGEEIRWESTTSQGGGLGVQLLRGG